MGYALGTCPLAAIVLAAWALHPGPVQAATVYRLNVFTSNGIYFDDLGILLDVSVSEESGLARFDFSNQSTINAVISAVYFEQGTLDSLESLIEGPGTSFSWPAHSGNLQSGQTLDPPFSTWFSADADPPPTANGIDPGETLTVRFNLPQQETFAGILNQLDSGYLRVGVHVIGLPDGSSEAAVTPEPTTALLLLGGAVLALAGRRPGRTGRRSRGPN